MKNVHLGRPTLSNRLTGRKKRGGNLTHDGANPVSGSDSHPPVQYCTAASPQNFSSQIAFHLEQKDTVTQSNHNNEQNKADSGENEGQNSSGGELFRRAMVR